MDPIEQAIRNAFAKGDPEAPAFREKVYRSASAALEKALLANPSLAPDVAERRRKGLLKAITSIESEFVPAVDPVVPSAPSMAPAVAPPVTPPTTSARSPDVPFSPPGPSRREDPSILAEPVGPAPVSSRREPEWPAPDIGLPESAGPRAAASAPTRDDANDRPRRRRGRWGPLAGLLSFLIIVGLAVWTAAEFGLVDLAGGPTLTDAGPQPSGADGAPRKPGEQEALENWVIVFSPDDPTSAAATAGALAEVIDAGGENALRITSGAQGAPVRFDVGEGILEQIAGRRAVFDIIAMTGDGAETQMSVACDFGALGDCGRNRYIVGTQRTELLFEVEVPAGAPSGAGFIEVVSDVENSGKAVQIIQIRVSTSAP